MTIVKGGTKVTTVLSNIQGIVTGTSIRFEAISYEVSYFNNGEYKQVWLNESEFTITEGKKQTIGFKNNHP